LSFGVIDFFFLLDEATSALDSQTEAHIQAALEKVSLLALLVQKYDFGAGLADRGAHPGGAGECQFTCFTRTKVRILTQTTLEKACKGRTAIVIAHRLSTVVRADKVGVIKGGRVVEIGTHRELLEKRGEYHAMWCRQVSQGADQNSKAKKIEEDQITGDKLQEIALLPSSNLLEANNSSNTTLQLQ
jgi:ABC-type multidrug transport system ATPase subunit